MTGYYRSFCKNSSVVVKPLTDLLRKDINFKWNDNCQCAFNSLKSLLCSSPVLAAPDFSRPFKLEVDASGNGAGAVLLQEDDQGINHPVCYYSKKFNRHQVNYSTIEKEALVLLLALHHFEVYIGSSPQLIDELTIIPSFFSKECVTKTRDSCVGPSSVRALICKSITRRVLTT